MRALIDGDVLIYRCCFARKDDEPFSHVSHNLESMLGTILKQTESKTYLIALTSLDKKANKRYEFAVTKPYKAGRPPRPEYFHEARQYLINNFYTSVSGVGEADDLLGILQETEDTIICSIDKDLLMIPGYHYNIVSQDIQYVMDPGYVQLNKEKSQTKFKGTGFIWFCAQMLTGDRVDNIAGVPKIGPVKAYNLLQGCKTGKDAWEVVRRTYKEYGLSKEQLKENALLLWIARQATEMYCPKLDNKELKYD